ncbi:hypothetical protein MMC30_007905 [Trapelia coarctata]|nr:hypothetical protein [Trapelia coarctata]
MNSTFEMDRDNSPSPSPRGISALDDTSFTSPPFMSTLPLPHPVTRRISDSKLPTHKMSPEARRGDGQSQKHHLCTRSATVSISSRSSSSSGPRSPGEENGHGRFNLGDYTIDLANLGQSSAGGRDLFAAMGGSDIETPVREREIVASEDDGPEDFTINLGKWMRGDGDCRKEDDDADPVKEKKGKLCSVDINDDTQRKERQASVEDMPEEENVEESVVVNTAPQFPKREAPENQEPSSTPPTTPLNHRNHFEQALRNSPPKPSALQVELDNLRLQAESYRGEIDSLDQARVQLETENEDTAKELRATKLSLEQSEKATADYHQRWETALKEQEASASNFASLRTRFDSLSQELGSTRKHTETTRIDSAQEVAALKEQVQTAQGQLAELPRLKDMAFANTAELSSLRSELARCKQDLQDQQRVSKSQEDALKSQIEDFRARTTAAEIASSNVTVLNQELEHAQAQLTETRRLLETVEDENDRYTQENERQAEEFKEVKNKLVDARRLTQSLQEKTKEKDVLLAKLERDIEQLQFELRSAEAQENQNEPLDSIARGSEKIDTAEADMRLADQLDTLSTHYEEEIASLKRVHEAEMKKLKGTLLRAADGMRKREARITSAHAEEVRTLRENVARLEEQKIRDAKKSFVDTSKPRKESETRPTEDGGEVQELRSAIRVLSSKLKTAYDELRKARGEIHELKIQGEERECEQQEREKDQEAVNKALDERVASVFQKREKEWRRRIRLVLRDRDMMGKALMWTWGKDEVGEREREVIVNGERVVEKGMGYRYQFVKR